MKTTNIREYLKNNVLLFDGAFGTYFSMKYRDNTKACELSNISAPERVTEVHREYLEAGATAIKTNTFGAYPEVMEGIEQRNSVVEAGYRIAVDAVAASGKNAYVFADIGPAPGKTPEEMEKQYIETADIFLKAGATNFVFETLSSIDGILECARHIRDICPDAFIIASFGVLPDGYSREGRYYRNLMGEAEYSGLFDVTGLNCVSSAGHMARLLMKMDPEELKHTSAMPNAGYPTVRGFRTFYKGAPEFFAREMLELAESGVRVLGGCCGTDPQYIKTLAGHLCGFTPAESSFERRKPESGSYPARKRGGFKEGVTITNRIWQKLNAGKKIIAVEFDSPKDTNLEKFIDGARRLQDAGVDTLTIADCPIARARMDSTLLACKVMRDLDLDVIPHMTCRDRNINATKALLLGGSAEGLRNVLVVTGDPIPTAERDEVQRVYQFNSRKLIAYIRSLNEELFDEPMMIFAALNVNAANFDVELSRAQEKVMEGADGFLTQPAMSDEAIENIKRARRELPPDVYILGGIIPVVSQRNGQFMESEISGIHIPEDMIQSYAGLNREEGEKLGERYSLSIAARLLPYVDGLYLMMPFERVALMERIVKKVKVLM